MKAFFNIYDLERFCFQFSKAQNAEKVKALHQCLSILQFTIQHIFAWFMNPLPTASSFLNSVKNGYLLCSQPMDAPVTQETGTFLFCVDTLLNTNIHTHTIYK